MELERIGGAFELVNSTKNTALIGTFGEQLATDMKNDVLVQFPYGISTYSVTSATANGGTVTSSDSMIVLSSSVATNGEASAESFDSLRYRPGHTALSQFTVMFPNEGVSGATQYAGIFDAEDGIYLGFNGTDRVVGYRNGGVDVQVTEANWNGDDEVHNYDWASLNVFRILFGWLGTSPIIIQVLQPETVEWKTIHSFILHGTLTKPHIGNPFLPVRMEIIKSSGSTDVVMKSGSWQSGSFGLCQTCGNRPFADETSRTLAANTNEQEIIHYRSVTSFNGKINKIRARLIRYQFYIDTATTGNGTVTFRLRRVGSVGGTPSWTPISSGNSVIEHDVAGTFVSTGSVIGLTEYVKWGSSLGVNVAAVSNPVVNAEAYNLFLDPAGIYALTAQNTSSVAVTVRVAFNWVELF